jgi:hypothetical protein
MTRIMLNFGDVRLQHPNIAKALDTYVRQVLMQDEEWLYTLKDWLGRNLLLPINKGLERVTQEP